MNVVFLAFSLRNLKPQSARTPLAANPNRVNLHTGGPTLRSPVPRWRTALALAVLSWLTLMSANDVEAQTALSNGAKYPGTITASATNAYTFTATTGDNLVIRVGQLSSVGYFNPWLRLYGPDGALIGAGAISGDVAEEIALTATNGGTFTVRVSDGNYGGFTGTGTYQLNYLKMPASYEVSSGDEGGALTNGTQNVGTIDVGDLDVWNFSANTGDSLVIRVGQLSALGYFNPWLRLYGPDGALIGTGASGGSVAQEIALTATNGGTFTVVVADGSYSDFGGTGTYQLNYLRTPTSYVVSPGDEGGTLANGTKNNGVIGVGDLDVWSFTANTGDSLVLRVGQLTAAAYFNPWVRLFGPDGVLIGTGASGGDLAEEIALTTTNSGTFTVLVSDGSYSDFGGTGTYQLNYLKLPASYGVSPGDEGGALTNGAQNVGTIDVGDLDVWNFSANTGDNLVLRVGQLTAAAYFNPWLRLYGPDGALIGQGASGGDYAEEIALTATNSGTFTVVVADGSYSGYEGTGTYQLNYLKTPGDFVVSGGDEGGPLANGSQNSATIQVGDLDLWSFSATNGNRVVLRLGQLTAVNYFNAWLRVYGPDGVLIGAGPIAGQADTEIAVTVTNTGTFTVLVADGNYSGYEGTGAYQLNFVEAPGSVVASPGDEGGLMTNGVTYNGTNSVGDLDSWNFYGTVGDSNVFRVVTTNFTPWLRLYGPSGSLVKEAFVANGNNRSNALTYVVANEGQYSLVLSAYYAGQTGTYGLKQSRVPPDLIVPATQIINEGDSLNVAISAQDPDVPFQPLTFTALALPAGASFLQTGPTNATITWATTEASGPSTNVIVASVTDVVNGQPFTRTNSFVVIVNELNEPPALTVPGAQTIDELTALNASASATDPDLPANPLTFSLISPPPGLTINPGTGKLTWTPTEAQGSNSYTVTVVVTDTNPPAVNEKQLSVTNSFTVTVNEFNTPPHFTSVPGTQTVTELTPLAVSVAAADDDLPTNPLTYGLVSPPTGMTINPNNGAISWTPTEAQGPNSYAITVTVADSNPNAINQKQFILTNSFTVNVTESNRPPVLTAPGPQTLDELTPLSVTATASDSDLPANPLTYALVSPPAGMNINAGTGEINWTPTEAQGPNVYTITVTATDTNAAAINQRQYTVTNSFSVTVNESNTPPVLQALADQFLHYGAPLAAQAVATDGDLPANVLTYTLDVSPNNMTINATSGVISWTPVLTQVGTNTVTVRVTDNGIPSKSDTKTFRVVVSGEQSRLTIQALSGGLKQINIYGDVGLNYELQYSTNLVDWSQLLQFNLTTSPYPYVDPAGTTAPRRFYRLKLLP